MVALLMCRMWRHDLSGCINKRTNGHKTTLTYFCNRCHCIVHRSYFDNKP